MLTFDAISDAADATRVWLIVNSADLPEHVSERLMSLTGTGASAVVLICNFAEAVYANQDAFNEQAKQIAGANAAFAERFGFHGMDFQGRGSEIALTLDAESVDPDPVPEPSEEWSEPAEPDAAPVPPAP